MLKLKNWTIKNFGQNNVVLDDINLEFKPKQLSAIIGASGIGKTTLINSIAINANIINGSLNFEGNEIDLKNHFKFKWFRKNIGIISQKSTLIQEISVYDNLKFVMAQRNNFLFKFFNIINKKQKQEIYDLLLSLKIIDKVFYKVSDLSGGEAQRVEIAKLFIRKPKIILADEPTSSLDLSNSKNIIAMLKKLTVELNAVGIVIIHNIELLKNEIDNVIALKDKKILFNKIPKLITESDFKKLYED
ncbi:MAG: ATP-binding cassette domain-containing protein [Malacoplasma sp.]|nr:ATP-binding cassette domain-containing protein [Malacoplasma sp.]